MRIPGFIIEHPVEALLGGALLLALIFGSADRHAAEVDQGQRGSQLATAQKL